MSRFLFALEYFNAVKAWTTFGGIFRKPVQVTMSFPFVRGSSPSSVPQKKSRHFYSQKNRHSDLQFFFWRARLAKPGGWRRFSFFLRFAPLAKNRAAQLT
jgi:hypothetical protein